MDAAEYKHVVPVSDPFEIHPPYNANYAWIPHFFYRLALTVQTGFVLAKGSLATKTRNEGEIRKAKVETDVINCIVSLPSACQVIS